MTMARMAIFALGCVCGLLARAEQIDGPETAVDWQASEAEAPAVIATDNYRGMYWLGQARRDAAELPGLSWHVDVGLPERLHKVVAFWPSVHWLSAGNIDTSMASLGYTWRNLKLEGALFKGRDADRSRNTEFLRLESTTRRMSYKSYSLAPNWGLRFSRGYRSSPDHLGQEVVRRTTASATYRTLLNGSPWHTTLAWGRGKESVGSSKNKLLLESAMRIGRQHLIFGRFERAGNDELFRNEPASHQRSWDANKYTLGYLYDVASTGQAKLGIGGLASRREVPSALMQYYGNDTSYMVFMRLHLQFSPG